MKPGRNDPCPCGSGKKYKQCCLASAALESQSPEQLEWRRVRQATAGLPDRVIRFMTEAYGDEAGARAWEAFVDWDDDLYEESQLMQLGGAWILHRWSPLEGEIDLPDPALYGVVPTRAYLQRFATRLNPLAVRYLEACVATPFSFFDIVDTHPGVGFTARDFFTGATHRVLEKTASTSLSAGDLLYAQLVAWDDFSLMEASSPWAFRPQDKIELLEWRESMVPEHGPWTTETLFAQADVVHHRYLDILRAKLFASLPTLTNVDGELFEQHRLVFDIDSAQAAFDALSHLAAGVDAAELLQDAERDDQGHLQRAEFLWTWRDDGQHEDATMAVMGQVLIDGRRLTISVNSVERAQRIRDIIADALGSARYRLASVRSGEALLGDAEPSSEDSRSVSPGIDRHETPAEVEAAVQDMLRRHYEAWVDRPLPALDGLTPLQAVQDRIGRLRVEALIQELERGNERVPLDPAIPRRLRERLGL